MLRHATQRLEFLLALGVRLSACISWAVEDFGRVNGGIEVLEKSAGCFKLLDAGWAGIAAVRVGLGDSVSR